jgi:glycosyltransferase involved in cell wall biosynthesis
MSSPRISVITPVYRPVIKELEHCLKSAKADGVEHVLVADGLENLGNPSAVKRLARKYSAKLNVSAEQKGISAASNEAVEKSLGEFLVFLDQDDFLVKCHVNVPCQIMPIGFVHLAVRLAWGR